MSTTAEDSTLTTYHGSCHCGSVTYTFAHPDPPSTWELTKCNCSICHKCNFLHFRIPAPYLSTFTVKSSAPEDIKDYTFNTHQVRHTSCAKCSVGLYRRGVVGGNEMLIVNVVTVDDLDLSGVGENIGYLNMRGNDYTSGRLKAPVAPGAP